MNDFLNIRDESPNTTSRQAAVIGCRSGVVQSIKVIDWREVLSAKQARIVAIAKRRNMPLDAPISDLQYGAPTVKDLQSAIYPDFTASIDSFLNTFDKASD